MKNKAISLFAFVLVLASLPALAQRDDDRWERGFQITQNPSVIEETGTEATLTWTTDRPTVTNVRYRAADGQWRSLTDQNRGTNHAVRLTGLQPGREVEWQILEGDGDVRTSGRFQARGQWNAGGPPRRSGYKPRVPLYRADHPTTGQHLYTADRSELDYLVTNGWRSSEIGYMAPTPRPDHVALFRVYVQNGDHFYTTSLEERDAVLRQGGEDEGVVGYISTSQRYGAYPLHRLVSTKTGYHFYTSNPQEAADAVRRQGFRDEGVMGYLFRD
jgi:Repeat of unknown function (DUF5648)